MIDNSISDIEIVLSSRNQYDLIATQLARLDAGLIDIESEEEKNFYKYLQEDSISYSGFNEDENEEE